MTRLFSAASALAILGSLFVSSCGFSLVNAARSDYRLGLAAERSGDLAKAREHQFAFYRQVTLLDDQPYFTALASFEYARLSGYAGDRPAADEAFLTSLRVMQKDIYADSRMRYKVDIEYARFLHDQGHHRASIRYYEDAIPRLTPSDLQGRDPIGFAEFLEEYGDSLARSGRKADAVNAKSWAAQLRREHPGRKADDPRRHYPRTLQPGQRRYPPMNDFRKEATPKTERRRYSPSVTPQSE